MKELEVNQQIAVEIREEQQQKKEVKFLGSLLKAPGHTLWEFNKVTNLVSPARFKTETVEIKSLTVSVENITNRRKVIVNDNCIYIQSLNKKNAIKKLRKQGYKPITL